MIDFNDTNRAIYLQIADDIADRIVLGALKPDQRIPSVREYAATVMVNVNTVMRAYEYLASFGVIYNKRGLGFFVSSDAPEQVMSRRRSEFIQGGGIERIFKQLQMLGISAGELVAMYSKYLQQ